VAVELPGHGRSRLEAGEAPATIRECAQAVGRRPGRRRRAGGAGGQLPGRRVRPVLRRGDAAADRGRGRPESGGRPAVGRRSRERRAGLPRRKRGSGAGDEPAPLLPPAAPGLVVRARSWPALGLRAGPAIRLGDGGGHPRHRRGRAFRHRQAGVDPLGRRRRDPPRLERRLLPAHLRRGAVEVLPGSGHLPMVESGPVVAARIARFLAEL